MRYAMLMVMGSAALAQSLQVPPSTAARGGIGSFLITLESPGGKAPAALQWRFQVPAGATVAGDDIVAGSAAGSVQKTLACVAGKQDGSIFNCILAGGQKPIPSGLVAVVQYQVAAEAHPGKATIHIDGALGASVDGKKVEIAASDGTLTIR